MWFYPVETKNCIQVYEFKEPGNAGDVNKTDQLFTFFILLSHFLSERRVSVEKEPFSV